MTIKTLQTAVPALSKIANCKSLAPATALAFSRIIKKIDEELALAIAEQDKIIGKFTVAPSEKTTVVSDSKQNKHDIADVYGLERALKELFDSDCDVELKRITFCENDISDAQLTANDFRTLDSVENIEFKFDTEEENNAD